MPIYDYEYYHGAVLTKILRNELPTTLRLIETNPVEAWSAYRVNDNLIVYMKYSASPKTYKKNQNRYGWMFNFHPKDLQLLRELMKNDQLYLALISTSKDLSFTPMEICLLNTDEIKSCIDIYSDNAQWFSVFCEPRKQLLVRGTISKSELKIPRNRLDSLSIPG